MARAPKSKSIDSLTYWDTYLSGLESCHFPNLYSGSAQISLKRPLSVKIDLQHLPVLLELSKSEDPRFVTLLQIAWALVLRCYTGLDNICFGLLEMDGGLSGDLVAQTFMDIPVARVNLEESKSVMEILETVCTEYQGSYNFRQCLPKSISQRIHTLGTPCFNTAILIRTEKAVSADIIDSAHNKKSYFSSLEECKLRLNAKFIRSRLSLFLEYSSTDFALGQAQNIAATFCQTLEIVLRSSTSLISDVNPIPTQHEQQIQKWNSKPLENVKMCIHSVIGNQVASQPDKIAVVGWDETFTYSQLDAASGKLAAHLLSLGLSVEDRVPLCFEKSAWNVVAMLAVIKAGGAFVPLDPTHPVQRLRTLVGRIGSRLLLCSRSYAETLAPVTEEVISIDASFVSALRSLSLPNVEVKPTNAAYIIFTSGSTGEPKGTILEHGAFCSSAAAHADGLLIKPSSRMLQFAAHTFDSSLVEILTPLMVGATVCIPSEEARLNDITGAINEMEADLAILTPSFVQFLDPKQLPTLKGLVLAGEAMSQSHIEKWVDYVQLGNGYGPTECAVCSVANPNVTRSTEPTDIGNAVGVHCWITDSNDHNRLVPIGCVGELVVEGHTLAREYLDDPQKTAEAFIENPTWASVSSSDSTRRMYKTGDLVRYNWDGSLKFVGRKDTQVKVHGQRVELGEIENQLTTDPDIKHALVLFPRAGLCRKRLVTVFTLSGLMQDGSGIELKVVDGKLKNNLVGRVTSARSLLADRVPAYMVPAIWIMVEALPLLTSGKLDRKQVSKWVAELDEDLYNKVTDVEDASDRALLSGDRKEELLRDVWARVLNLNVDKVAFNRSFLSLGGDSISAMQVIAMCQKHGIGLTVREILRSKSIPQLASTSTVLGSVLSYEEVLEEPFDLTPIQGEFFKLPNQGRGHFNQSTFVRVTRLVSPHEVRIAAETIVSRHSMLRARFTQSDTGEWSQRLTNNVGDSLRFTFHTIATESEATIAIAQSQISLDPVEGPLFAVDLFSVTGTNDLLLFMVGHHLVIDLVSWRVILHDFEELLDDPQAARNSVAPLPFQTWAQLQKEHALKTSVSQVLPVENVPLADFEYWGLSAEQNTYGTVACDGFELDEPTTMMLLSTAHTALRTEVVDVLVASMLHSFANVFSDRGVAPIYNEGHGREPWDSAINLSRTVGWFTTMYPVIVHIDPQQTVAETVKLVKDLRRRVPDNGRPYWAKRCLTEEGKAHFGKHWPMELTFNYLGQYQQLERDGALLRPVNEMAGEARGAGGTADVGEETPRFGLFEISAVIVSGKLRYSFTYNRTMKHQAKISTWISQCKQTISTAVMTLSTMSPQYTLSDFPLASISYQDLNRLEQELLPALGLAGLRAVEDLYPVSQMQQGLLISQSKSESFYAVSGIFEVKTSEGIPEAARILAAWQAVVGRHPALRTLFIDSIGNSSGIYSQIVLRDSDAEALLAIDCIADCITSTDAFQRLKTLAPARYDEAGKPPHRFTVCSTSQGNVLFKLELSHTIMDGASMDVMFRDLALAYENRLPEGSGPLYREYIAFLEEKRSESSFAYWKDYLKGVEPCHFPILNDGEIGARRELSSIRLEFKEMHSLIEHCKGSGITLSNAIHTAWALTLRCFIGAEEVCFGYLTSGRDAPISGVEDIVGPMINMLTCRVAVPGSASLVEVLQRVQKDYEDCLPHRHISLAELHHELRLTDIALFNTCLSYRKLSPLAHAKSSSVTFKECEPYFDPTEYKVSLNVEASDDTAVIDLDYWTDVISEGHAANIASTFMQSLRNIVAAPSSLIRDLSFFNEHDRKNVLAWNANMPASINKCVHHVIEEQVRKQPNAPALHGWDGQLTYAQLDRAANRLAHYLVGLGVGPETFVPTCFDKSIWTVVAMLAVLKSGAGCVPLDATHPKSALEVRVEDTAAQVVVAASHRADMFDDIVSMVVSVDAELFDILPDFEGNACLDVTPQNPAFIIFTSGSTGRPKGVVLEHSAMVTSAEAHGSKLGIGPETRFLQFAAYTFDNSLEEMFTTLERGGCVCVPSDQDRLSNLAGVINQLQCNFMDLTPTVATCLRPADVPTIKGLGLGGEALTKQCAEIWLGHVVIHNQYGPSECSINSAHNKNIRISNPTNIGKSVGSLSWVVDPNNHDILMPIGCPGELLIEGPICARGYLNDDEKTKSAFIINPTWTTTTPSFGSSDRRMYKTGDLVRYNCDGTMTYLGRKDTQVKLNGQRIELGEIEHHVKINLPEEAQSAVELILTGPNKNVKALAAFLDLPKDANVPEPIHHDLALPMTDHAKVIAKHLETTIGLSLPSYMVPTIFIPIAKMPLTSSGKTDRRTIRLMAQALTEEELSEYRLAGRGSRQVSTISEKRLQKLWGSVLGIESSTIGADDSFFRLGGDSVAAMRMVSAGREDGVILTVATVFSKPLLCDMAKSAEILGATDALVHLDELVPFSLIGENEGLSELLVEISEDCNIERDLIEDVYPCTSLQEGLIALSMRQPGAYVAQNIYRLPKDIDLGRFKSAWETVTAAEVILRTRIVHTRASKFLQIVVRKPMAWFSATTLEDIGEEDRLIPGHSGGQLCRYTIVGEGTDVLHFVWTVHHAVYDGWCFPIILQQVALAYAGSYAPNHNLVQYPQFIKYLSSVTADEMGAFWRNRLSNIEAAQFPQLPQPSYQIKSTSLLQRGFTFSNDISSGITSASLLRAAWAIVVAAYSGSEDVVFGETFTGRDAPLPGIDTMIGPTLATVPMRVSIKRDMTVAAFLEEVQAQAAETIPFQHAGLQHIRKLSSDTASACDFQNLIVVNRSEEEPESDFVWDIKSSGTIGTNFYTYPLMLSCNVNGKTISIDAHYDQDILPVWQVSRLLHYLEASVVRLSDRCNSDTPLGDLSMVTDSDLEVIAEWNSKPLLPASKCIHKEIERRAQGKTADHLAIDGWDGKFSYSKMDNLSTRLAHLLVGYGIQKGVLVPICFEKSSWTIVAMLAILKAGAAFVPLDPAYPAVRLRTIISDTNANLVLCSAKHFELCESIAPQVFAVDNSVGRLPLRRAALPEASSGDAAYVIFTSGTTGKPKGTIVEHGAFCEGALAHGPAMLMRDDSRVLQFASYTFDASIMEIFTTFLLGGCVCVPDDKERLDDLSGAINRMGVTWALITPSVASLIEPTSVPDLKTLVLGGEAMGPSHIETWSQKLNLVNAYGPSETSVVAAVNPKIIQKEDLGNIGRAVGGHCWVVDAYNQDRLVPIGSVGELLVEGPILARGYLNLEEKTREVFITDPKWSGSNCKGRRFYKTGDLVKYNEKGEIIFMGRKDNQVKLHGQRMELGEVEYHLSSDSQVKHALVFIPTSGLCKKKLVSVISLKNDLILDHSDSNDLGIVPEECLSGIRDRLRERLPAYMIPTKWIATPDIPFLPSGKLDRKQVAKWLEDIDTQTYQAISQVDAVANASDSKGKNDVEKELQSIWGHVLNIPSHQVSISTSFLHLGGDSISAMQVMSRCRAKELGVTVQDILQSKSIADLAKRVTVASSITYEEITDQEFELSPIQRLYFQCVGKGQVHFNQSVLLKVSSRQQPDRFKDVFATLVSAHSMLRARFSRDIRSQFIVPNSPDCFRFTHHQVDTNSFEQIRTIVEDSQITLDIYNGPVFSVDLLDGDEQVLSIVAHHLVIDVVSWKVILQDLEDILMLGTLKVESSLPFQTWIRAQREQAEKEIGMTLLPFDGIPAPNFDFWNMAGRKNLSGDVISEGFDLNLETSAQILGLCNNAFKTEPIDVLLASICHSFHRSFPDRETPAIFNEGHGRETWNGDLDLSRTVGWFTTMCPVSVSFEADDDVLSTVCSVKDVRRRTLGKGRPYFAARLLVTEYEENFKNHWPIEITFNYLGQNQQLERADSVLKPFDNLSGNSINNEYDVGSEVPRFSLFEISASVTQGILSFTFTYSSRMGKQPEIQNWILECQSTLEEMVELLVEQEPQSTPSDYPLLPLLTVDGLESISDKLYGMGISLVADVEDIYPCSPMQQGMLLSQIRDPGLYSYQFLFRVRDGMHLEVDKQRLVDAWQDVVNFHSCLRTIFVDSTSHKGLMDQIVLKECIARTNWIECAMGDDPQHTLTGQRPINYRDGKPPHQLTICTSANGSIMCMLDISHTISDGTSMPLILRDLALAYEQKLNQGLSVPVYGNFIAHIQRESRESTLDYWKSYLTDVEPCHFPNLSDGGTERELRSLTVELSKGAELQPFCVKNGVTLANILQLTWGLVLRSYTGSDDVCFGYLKSGREAPISGISDAVGAFINMCICRLRLSHDTAIKTALNSVQEGYIGSMSHQNCSLAEIQHQLRLGSALFNSAFSFQKRTATSDIKFGELIFDVMDAKDPSEYHITVNVEVVDSQAIVSFGYWTDGLSDRQAQFVADTFDKVLASIISGHELIGEIDAVGNKSKDALRIWNAGLPKTVDRCIHDIIEQQARSQPKAKQAVCAFDETFTYTELDRMATRLASHLRVLGVGPEVYVPLCFNKTAWSVVAMLAVLKAGGAFVPLDHTHPKTRLKSLIEDIGARLVLCSTSNAQLTSGLADKVLVVDESTIQLLANTPIRRSGKLVKTSNAAYIIFTSGTTGKPKGTIIEHAAFATGATAHGEAMLMKASSRVLQFASYTFDASIMEILTTLMLGGTVCMPSDEQRLDDITTAINNLSVSWTLLTPSVAHTIDPAAVPCLKVLVLGGEAMSASDISKWSGKVSLVNAYGPSECSVVATTSTKVDENGVLINQDPSNIGTATGGRCWIVDARNHDALAPIGAIGELVVEGRLVARGYLNEAEKTSAAFVKNPRWLSASEFGNKEGQLHCVYKTGDLVRYNSDGSISFVGRRDMQIKLNGQRIELGEIEHHVKLSLPEGAQGAVELLRPAEGKKALTVFFTHSASAFAVESRSVLVMNMTEQIRTVARDLEAKLAASSLPSYMVPTIFVPVYRMPWTSSGKLDRAMLRREVQSFSREQIASYRLASSSNKRPPSSNMEKRLARVWEDILELKPSSLGIDDSFFLLGGDSISSIQLVAAARLEGISLTVQQIFKNPRLSSMALVATSITEVAEEVVVPFSLLRGVELESLLRDLADHCEVARDTIIDAYPTTSLQEGLIALSTKQAGAYVAMNVFRLPADVHIGQLQAAWQRTVDEEPILRTRIVQTSTSQFFQVLLQPQQLTWTAAKSLQSISEHEQHLPAYNGGPLTKFIITNEDTSGARYFVWCVHHALYDGWSMPLILKRVESAYFNTTQISKSVPFAGFIKYLVETDEEASESFWRKRLENATSLQFPPSTRSNYDDVRTTSLLSHTITLQKDLNSLDVTAPTLIRAAWAIIVAAYSGSEDVIFGETLTGRDIAVSGIIDMVGPTLATVPTRIIVNKDTGITVSAFLNTIHEWAAETIPHQHIGLQRIKKLDADSSLACDFQNLLVIHPKEDSKDGLWDLQSNGVASNFFTYPLVVECKIGGCKIEIDAHHDANMISSWQVQRILYQLGHILNQLRSGLEGTMKLSDVELFSPEDNALVGTWNGFKLDIVDRCVHDLFVSLSHSQPQAPAISSWDGDFTYSQVRELSGRLAGHLVEVGHVGPDSLVPICFDKSAWAIIAMFAILRAGGAFVPLDPAHPDARHREIVEDVNAAVILCSPQYYARCAKLVGSCIPVDANMVDNLPLLPRNNTILTGRTTSNNPAYVIFTSGTTGKPKGAVIEHAAFATSSKAYTRAMLMQSTSRILQFASYTFDASVMEILSGLTIGACLCVPSEDERVNDVGGAIKRMNVTWALLTPSVAGIIEPSTVPGMDVLVCGGEAMSLEIINRWKGSIRALVNAYGPTECSVVATVNAQVFDHMDPSNIGQTPGGGYGWILDPTDHNRLSPVGSVGELAIEGPVLARGYLDNPEKTAEVFIEDPTWARGVQNASGTRRRLYKTGDLVRYNPDGTFRFIGRKDNQVKLNGQRLELGEIEHRLETNPKIRHSLIAMPKIGSCKKRLVAVLSLMDISSCTGAISAKGLTLVDDEHRAARVKEQIAEAKEILAEQLPPYMVPTIWVVVESIPMLPSGKLDRKQVARWVETVDDETYRRVSNLARDEGASIPTTPAAHQIQKIWAQVLNLSIEVVKTNISFLSLGGDSITAMQVMARARKENLDITMHDVLRCKSIAHLASTIKTDGLAFGSDTREEVLEELFELSPIQRLYFEFSNEQTKDAHFNQSFTLKISSRKTPSEIRKAIELLVTQHSMLRARFVKDASEAWKQKLTNELSGSYRFFEETVHSPQEMIPTISRCQRSLDIESGPLFSAALFDVTHHQQVLFLVAHHLVIDLMSWRIILQDLEEILKLEKSTIDKPLSFQTWCKAQEEDSAKRAGLGVENILPLDVAPADMAYWGMEGRKNTYSDIELRSFTMDRDITALAMNECHNIFRTEPIDLFLSALLTSFTRVFSDRSAPAVFNEAHGREPSGMRVDLSRTVGWFTTLAPVYVGSVKDVIEALKMVKDMRRKLSDNGRPYFAHRYLTVQGRNQLADHMPAEIAFNYLGQYQQLEQGDSLLQQYDLETKSEEQQRAISDVGQNASRLALHEVSVVVTRGEIRFSFMFSRSMQHQSKIEKWIFECQRTLREAVNRLALMDQPELTLADFPLLPMQYSHLARMESELLPQIGITRMDEVDEMFPCSPMQEGMLLSQLRDPGYYAFESTLEVKGSRAEIQIDSARLARAWQKVVNRHSALRTIFVDSICRDGSFDQVVLKQAKSGVVWTMCDDTEVFEVLSSLKKDEKKLPHLPHQLSVVETTSGKVYCKIAINHALIDGGSVAVLLGDLALAYDGRMSDIPALSYCNYIQYIRSRPANEDIDYWKRYLKGVQPCHFPVINENSTEKHLSSVHLRFDRFGELQELCESMGVTISNIMLAAWGLVLRSYASMDDVCFGYLAAGRDAPLPGIQEAVGAFINMLVCRIRFTPTMTLESLFKEVQDSYLEGLPYQHCSLAQIHHEVGSSRQALFNTAISIQNNSAASDAKEVAIGFHMKDAKDPSEYAVTLNIETGKGNEGVLIRYWTDTLSDSQASMVAGRLSHILSNIIDRPSKTIAELDGSNEQSQVDEVNWNSLLRKITNECVHEIIEKMFKTGELVRGNTSEMEALVQAKSAQVQMSQSSGSLLTPISGNSNPDMRKVINECVHEIIDQIFKTGDQNSLSNADIMKLVRRKSVSHPRPRSSRRKSSYADKLKPASTTIQTYATRLGPSTADRIRTLWGQMLGIQSNMISLDDSFFTLGGDSIIAMKMVGVGREQGIFMTVADIFRYPKLSDLVTIVRVAGQVEEKTAMTAPELSHATGITQQELMNLTARPRYQPFSLLKISDIDTFLQTHICPKVHTFRGGILDVLPCTDFQSLAVAGSLLESRWMLNYFYLDGTGPLDLRMLKQSAFRMVHTYDILRTVFVAHNDRFLQVILRKLQPEFFVYETEGSLDDFTLGLQQRDKNFGPRLGNSYMQFTVVKQRGGMHHRIIMRISHAQYDGVCLPEILSALQAGYQGLATVPPPTYANYLRESVGTITRAHYGYWQTLLKGSTMTEIVKRSVPNYNRASGMTSTLKRTVPVGSLTSSNITSATIVKGAWAAVLAKLTGTSDVVFGHTISGRNSGIPDVERIVGPCLNIVPVRVRFQQGWSILDLLQFIQDQQIANMPYEGLGFREITKQCTDWPNWINYSTVLQHQNIDKNSTLKIGNVDYRFGGLGSQEDVADFSVLSMPQGFDKIELTVTFSTDGVILLSYAEMVLDMLATTVERFSTSPEALLPSPNDLQSLTPQVLKDSYQPSITSNSETSLSLSLDGLNERYLLMLSSSLNKAWSSALINPETKITPTLRMDSHFFALGGDILNVAQVAMQLQSDGFKVRLEDLIDNPKMFDQLSILAKTNARVTGGGLKRVDSTLSEITKVSLMGSMVALVPAASESTIMDMNAQGEGKKKVTASTSIWRKGAALASFRRKN